MTLKKKMLALVVIFVLTAVTNFLIHGILLQSTYASSAGLMRAPQDGQAHAPYLLVAFGFFSLAFVGLYGAEPAGRAWWIRGASYAVGVWLVATVSRYFINYAIQPWPFRTVILEIGLELAATLLLGETLAFVASR